MTTFRTAKLFMHDGAQAVRLPAEFRFEGDEVHVRRDERTGNVILSPRREVAWLDFMALRHELGPVPAGFLADRQLDAQTRDPLDSWVE